jgi:hypothetical protein
MKIYTNVITLVFSAVLFSTVSSVQQNIGEESRKILRQWEEVMRKYSKAQHRIEVPVPTFPVSESGKYSEEVQKNRRSLEGKEVARVLSRSAKGFANGFR